MRKTHDHVHRYRGYWSDGGRCRIRIFQEDEQAPVVVCSQLPDNHNTSVTNMVEYLAAEFIEELSLPTPLTWIERYPVLEYPEVQSQTGDGRYRTTRNMKGRDPNGPCPCGSGKKFKKCCGDTSARP